MAVPEDVTVWIGLHVGKEEHYADVLDNDGDGLFHRSVVNDEADLDAWLARAATFGQPGVVIDQPGSIAQLAIAVAARRGVPVAYAPGLMMRRAADLYPGEAKTNRRDAFGHRCVGGCHWPRVRLAGCEFVAGAVVPS